MGAGGANTVTRLLLHLGLGELAGGGLLRTSCRGGEGRWDQRGSGFTEAQTLMPPPPPPEGRAAGWIGGGPQED